MTSKGQTRLSHFCLLESLAENLFQVSVKKINKLQRFFFQVFHVKTKYIKGVKFWLLLKLPFEVTF